MFAIPFRPVVYDSVHLTVARSNKEEEEADSSEIRRGKSLEHRLGSERLAQVVDATERVRAHRHRDALQKEGLALFKELFESVYEAKQRCA